MRAQKHYCAKCIVDLIWSYKILFGYVKNMFVKLFRIPTEQYTWTPLQVI